MPREMRRPPPAGLLDARLARAAVESAPVNVLILEPVRDAGGAIADFVVAFANESALRLGGLTRDQVLGRPRSQLPVPWERASFEELVACVEQESTRCFDCYSAVARRRLRCFLSPLPGGLIGAYMIDVSKETEAMRLLTERELELREAQRVARLGSWNRDLLTGTTEWSEGTYRIHGLDPSCPRPTPEDSRDFYEAQSAAAILAAYERLRADGTPYEVEVKLKPGPGRARAMIARGEAVRDDGGRIVRIRGTVIDVSEQAEAEQKLDELRAELARVGRRTVLGEVAASLAHELNQPLAAILSDAETAIRLLRGTQHARDDLNGILADIAAQTQRAADVIRRLRSQLRRDTPAPEPLDLNRLVRGALRLTATEARHRGATATLDLAESLPPVLADRVQLQQVLINLLLNALDAVEKRPPPRGATVKTWSEAGRVALSVSDSGPGIPGDALEKVFEPFFSTKPGGLGVGLSISRTIVETHGGRIRAANAPGGGAVLVLELPAASPPGAAEVPGR